MMNSSLAGNDSSLCARLFIRQTIVCANGFCSKSSYIHVTAVCITVNYTGLWHSLKFVRFYCDKERPRQTV